MHTGAPTSVLSQQQMWFNWRSAAILILPVAIVAVLPLLPFVNNYIIAATVRALIFISLGQARSGRRRVADRGRTPA